MLATPAFTYPVTAPSHDFLPKTPSPLSPRSANIHGRPPPRFATTAFMSDSEKERLAKDVPFSKRAVKKAPSPKPDELKERRRSMFLRKVKDGREERRFEARGEDIMRLDFVRQQRLWEAQLAREAPLLSSDSPEEEVQEQEGDSHLPAISSSAMQMSAPSTQQPWLEDEADEVMQRERAELEALLSFMPVENQEGQQWDENDVENVEHLYSDDDDYDALFFELMEQDEPREANLEAHPQEHGDAMDIS